MVGDSYEQDALAPRSFGVQGVWFNPEQSAISDPASIPVVSDLRSLSAWVAKAVLLAG